MFDNQRKIYNNSKGTGPARTIYHARFAMYAPAANMKMPDRVLFLSRRESSVRSDAKVLRALGIRSVNHVSKSEELLSALLKNGLTGIAEKITILCDDQCADAGVLDFLQLLADNDHTASCHVAVLSGMTGLVKELKAAGIPALARPYALEDLGRLLSESISPRRSALKKTALSEIKSRRARSRTCAGPSAESAPPFKAGRRTPPRQGSGQGAGAAVAVAARKAQPLTTTDIFTQGMENLRNKNTVAAETAFIEVLRRQEDHMEACLAMASLCRDRGETRTMQAYLLRAAASCLRQGDTVKAETIAALLPEQMRGPAGVLTFEAVTRMDAGEFSAAALSFLEVSSLFKNLQLHTVIARACQFTAHPEESLGKLCEAYDRLGHPAIAGRIRQRLLQPVQEYDFPDVPSWLDKFPRLQEAVSVAAFTALAWKHA